MRKHYTVLVLADGETWETIGGQSIITITAEQFQDLCEDRIDARDLNPLSEIGLDDFTPKNKESE